MNGSWPTAHSSATRARAPETMTTLNPTPENLPGSGRVVVAFSGGPDSSCLLHQLAGAKIQRPLVAIHVDHGLDAESGERAQQAKALAESFGTECTIVRIEVEHRASLEEAAREARYRALAACLEPGDVLLTAHHADDQVETVFQRLVRGAGPRGLAGMPRRRRLDGAWLVRPMLDWSRAQIDRYLADHAIEAIDDPANRDLTHDRNFLRHHILPELRSRWPGLERAVLASADLNREAAEALRELADIDLDACRVGERRLDRDATVSLPRFRQGQMIRHWCQTLGLEAPPGRRLESFREQLASAADDRTPELRWSGAVLRSWNRRLWLDRRPEPDTEWRLEWPDDARVDLPDGLGRLELPGGDRGLAGVVVCAGSPGERIRPAGRQGTRPVTQLMAEAAVPPWQRPMWPRLWRDEELLAVGDQWLSEAFARELDQRGIRLRWAGDTIRG